MEREKYTNSRSSQATTSSIACACSTSARDQDSTLYLPDVLTDNLRFLVLEVHRQLERTRAYLHDPTPEARKRLLSRDDYIDNLRTFLQRACFENPQDVDPEYARAMTVVSANLERIADFCENILRQFSYVTNKELFSSYDFSPFFDVVLQAVPLCEEAILERDISTAIRVARAEPRLDQMYSDAFKGVLLELEGRGHPQTYVTILFVLHYFERMGDALLNIGEAVISASLGERVKIGQLWALEETLDRTVGKPVEDLDVRRVGQSRSGCDVVRIDDPDREGAARPLIYKEGDSDKLLEEKEGIERFEALMPGVAPRILSFHPQGPHSALLFEYLSGRTLEELVLGGTPEELRNGLDCLLRFLPALWDTTKIAEPTNAHCMRQARRRLPDVFDVHPDFKESGGAIGNMELLTLEQLIDQADLLEAKLAAPFSVLIHGDFNADNIIYNDQSDTLRLIDLHRAKRSDYCQDISVFMVSNYRLQVIESPVRRRIVATMGQIQQLGKKYAEMHADSTYEARLALGLARSLITSSRFVFDNRFAKNLVLRAEFLLRRLLSHPVDSLHAFRIPRETFT